MKTRQTAYVVSAEWADDTEGEQLAIFTGASGKQRAQRYAEEMEHRYATGGYVPGRHYSVFGVPGERRPTLGCDDQRGSGGDQPEDS